MDGDLLTDAMKVGMANLVFVKVLQNVFPNNIPAQVFLSGTLFHITMEYFKVKHWYLEQPEYK
jgi:hypothetical protein